MALPVQGKAHKAKKIIDKYKLTHIATGDSFRKHLGEGTDFRELAQKYMDEGNLVPDEVVIGHGRGKKNQRNQSQQQRLYF